MNGAATDSTQEIARLRQERRGFIIGSLIVLAVTIVTIGALGTSALPHAVATAGGWRESYRQLEASAARNPPPLTMVLVWMAGALGLFVLNLRFSREIRHPHAAYQEGGGGARFGWWLVVAFCSLTYAMLLFPELALLWLLAHWSRQEYEARARARPEP